jgi:hypothetical protein
LLIPVEPPFEWLLIPLAELAESIDLAASAGLLPGAALLFEPLIAIGLLPGAPPRFEWPLIPLAELAEFIDLTTSSGLIPGAGPPSTGTLLVLLLVPLSFKPLFVMGLLAGSAPPLTKTRLIPPPCTGLLMALLPSLLLSEATDSSLEPQPAIHNAIKAPAASALMHKQEFFMLILLKPARGFARYAYSSGSFGYFFSQNIPYQMPPATRTFSGS